MRVLRQHRNDSPATVRADLYPSEHWMWPVLLLPMVYAIRGDTCGWYIWRGG